MQKVCESEGMRTGLYSGSGHRSLRRKSCRTSEEYSEKDCRAASGRRTG